MANLLDIVNEVKGRLEEGAQLLEAHIPDLLSTAQKIEGDPLVQVAINTLLPAPWKQLAADFIGKLEGLAAEAEAAKAAAVAEAAAAPVAAEPEPAPAG